MHAFLSPTRALFPIALVVLYLGCSKNPTPAMTPITAGSQTAMVTDQASVTLIRPESRCDSGDYSIVVDDQGKFVANLGPGTQVTVAASPGPHVYYAWSSRDLRSEAHPEFNPVAAMRLSVTPHGTSYVALIVTENGAVSRGCNRYAMVALVPLRENGPYWQDLDAWLSSTQPLAVDADAGQALLATEPERVRSYLEFGRIRLQHADERRAQREADKAVTAP